MSPHSNITKDVNPKAYNADQLQKGLDCLLNLLTAKRTKRAQPHNADLTTFKMANILLTQMLARCSTETASEILGMIGKVVYSFAAEVIKQPQISETLHAFIRQFSKDHGESLFNVAVSTLDANLATVRNCNADHILTEQVEGIQAQLRKQGLWSKDVSIIVDPTDTYYRGKYYNQYHNFGIVGQQPSYKRAFKEVAVFTNPAQLMVGSKIAPVIPENFKDRDLPLWIELVQEKIQKFSQHGTTAKVIMGDRGYYSSLGMAYSYFGLWLPHASVHENPRMIVPKKIWDDSLEKKWDFLLDNSQPGIQREFMGLDHYQLHFLGAAQDRLVLNETRTKREVGVLSIAIFDAYGNNHRIESLDWGRKQAYYIETQLHTIQAELTAAETEYLQYCRTLGRHTPSLPKYKGRRRRVFRNFGDRSRYLHCCACSDRLHAWLRKKKMLAQRLMFFRVSTREGEMDLPSEQEMLALIRQYHERWGIENGFKDLRYKFWVRTNSRKPTARHIRFTLSALVYNAWHFHRLIRIARIRKKSTPNWKPFHFDLFPVREKFEAAMPRVLTAQGYIIEQLELSLKIGIKKQIARVL